MNKIELKKVLIDLEENTIGNAVMNYNDFLSGNHLDRENVIEVDDQAQHRASLELSDKLDEQIHEHETHLAILNNLSFEPTEVVKPGAVLHVNGRCIVVATPKSKFNFAGKDFIGISTKAPIYAQIKDKRAGDNFSFNGKNYQIETVH